MGEGALGRAAGKVDHLLPGQRHLADERDRQPLLLGLLEEAGVLLLVEIDEGGLRSGLLDLRDVGGEVGLALLARHVGDDLDAGLLHLVDEDVMAALAEIVVDPGDGDLLHLQRVPEIGRQRRHALFRAGRGAEDEGIALLR